MCIRDRSISFSSRCRIAQYFIVWTDIAVIFFIICIVVFLKETPFCHWSFVWHVWILFVFNDLSTCLLYTSPDCHRQDRPVISFPFLSNTSSLIIESRIAKHVEETRNNLKSSQESQKYRLYHPESS